MRYVKKENGHMVEFSGPSMGGSYYQDNGYTGTESALPLDRLDIVNGELVELPAPAVEVITYFSCYKVYDELRKGGIWPEIKTYLQNNNILDDIYIAHELPDTHPIIVTLTTTYLAKLVSIGLDLNLLYQKCKVEKGA